MVKLLIALTCFIISSTLSGCSNDIAEHEVPVALEHPHGPIILEVKGSITHTNSDASAIFDMAMLERLPITTIETTTSATDGILRFEGFLVRDLLRRLGAKGETLTATAHNQYAVNIPLSDFDKFDTIIAYKMNGKYLDPHNKGPLWIIYPRDHYVILQDIRYDYRWVWQLKALEVQ